MILWKVYRSTKYLSQWATTVSPTTPTAASAPRWPYHNISKLWLSFLLYSLNTRPFF